MGKRSQAKGRWPTKKREQHTFIDNVADIFGHMYKVTSRGLARHSKATLQKQLDDLRKGKK